MSGLDRSCPLRTRRSKIARMTQHAECLAKLMALHIQEISKVTLGRKFAAFLLHSADRRNDVFEVGLHDLRLERCQNQFSCAAVGHLVTKWGEAFATNSTNLHIFTDG
jgi:hypothetical protein